MNIQTTCWLSWDRILKWWKCWTITRSGVLCVDYGCLSVCRWSLIPLRKKPCANVYDAIDVIPFQDFSCTSYLTVFWKLHFKYQQKSINASFHGQNILYDGVKGVQNHRSCQCLYGDTYYCYLEICDSVITICWLAFRGLTFYIRYFKISQTKWSTFKIILEGLRTEHFTILLW